jgi:hypothetical protein
MRMKRLFSLWVALLFSASVAFAGTQKWTAGWNNFNEPLNYTKSKVTWSVTPAKRTLSLSFTLAGATPNKLYQVRIAIFCTTFPATFGQFPTQNAPGGTCTQFTIQGVTKSAAVVEFGVVTTDIHGNGKFAVVVGPISSGTYELEFAAEDGAGCNLIGGAGNGPNCAADFQSPGPTWGDATTIVIP